LVSSGLKTSSIFLLDTFRFTLTQCVRNSIIIRYVVTQNIAVYIFTALKDLNFASMASRHFVGPWPFFSFSIILHSRQNSLDGDLPITRPLPAHRTTQTQNKSKQTSIPQVGFESTTTTFKRAKTVHALYRAATVIC
jgi:hypothetical protein